MQTSYEELYYKIRQYKDAQDDSWIYLEMKRHFEDDIAVLKKGMLFLLEFFHSVKFSSEEEKESVKDFLFSNEVAGNTLVYTLGISKKDPHWLDKIEKVFTNSPQERCLIFSQAYEL